MQRFVQYRTLSECFGQYEIADEDFEFLRRFFSEAQIDEMFANRMTIDGIGWFDRLCETVIKTDHIQEEDRKHLIYHSILEGMTLDSDKIQEQQELFERFSDIFDCFDDLEVRGHRDFEVFHELMPDSLLANTDEEREELIAYGAKRVMAEVRGLFKNNPGLEERWATDFITDNIEWVKELTNKQDLET